MTDTSTYEKRLRDVIRPDVRSEREDARTYTVSDAVALAFVDAFDEMAAYGADSNTREIAAAYGEYVNYVVRDEGRGYVTFYAHTEKADEVLKIAAQMTRAALENTLESEELFIS